MKIEFGSQRREMLLFLTTNMAAMTSRANQQIKLNSPTDLTPTRLSDTEQSVNVTNLIPHKT